MIKSLIFKSKNWLKRRRYQSFARIAPHAVLHPEAQLSSDSKEEASIRIGDYSHIRSELGCYGGHGSITIGDRCYVGPNTRIWSWDHIEIGDRVLISHNVNIFDSDAHPMDAVLRAAHFASIVERGHIGAFELNPCPVILESDTWIGCSAIILKGVKIGTGAVVGAGSVVTRDVPPWHVVAGNPARTVKVLK